VTTRWDAYKTALPSIAHAVGRTPLVRLGRVTAGVSGVRTVSNNIGVK